jgi:mannose-6-phosphate isomerase-like protein (cupin superfamily)
MMLARRTFLLQRIPRACIRFNDRLAGAVSESLQGRPCVLDVVLKRFDHPDEVRTFEKGRFELIHLAGMTLGRATYEPGWKWSVHVGRALGKTSCDVEHVGIVIAGRATAAMDDGRIVEMKAGDVFYIAPGHDSWVVGDEPYVSLHLMGAGDYAQHKAT